MDCKTYHTVWLSDIHLGNPNCQYDKLLTFLRSLEKEDGSYYIRRLYLVGDIIDMTQFNHRVFWSQHRSIIKKFFRMADKGVEIVYIRGNHDWFLEREFDLDDGPQKFNNITIRKNHLYHSLSGQKFFILHGDEFDGVVRANPKLYKVGDVAYKVMIKLNLWQNKVRDLFGIKRWSFAQWIKYKVKRAIQYVNNYEDLVRTAADEHDADGVICGHIHQAADKNYDEIRYLNCGCWVEFCSYIVEHKDGKIEMVMYADS